MTEKKRWCGLVVFVLFLPGMDLLAADDYLQSLEAEAARVDQPVELAPEEEAKSGSSVVDDTVAEKRGAFEALLKSRHKGTYSIYRTLIEKDRAEVFAAFDEGLSLREVRKMIINRKMHR